VLNAQTISIILPVLNEAVQINTVLAGLRSLRHEHAIEIIVVDGDPGGGTINAVTDREALLAIAAKGRASQMNHGAALATGGILLFLHADTFLPENAVTLIQNAMSNNAIDAGAFGLGFDTKKKIFKVTERYAALRTRLTGIPFGDQALFFRKNYFEKIGGFKNIPLMEDIEIMNRIKKSGGRICILPEKVLTSPRRWEREGLVFCLFRNWALQLGYALGVPPDKLARWYKQ